MYLSVSVGVSLVNRNRRVLNKVPRNLSHYAVMDKSTKRGRGTEV